MNDIEFKFIGWNKSTDKDGKKHDKVWTAFSCGNKYYAGWGARGKSIRFKQHDGNWELNNMIGKKEKTYNEVDTFQLFSIFPHFKDDVEKYLTYAVLGNKVG